MNRMHVVVVVSVIGGAAVVVGQSGSTPAHPGRLLASNCFQCHGTNGNAVGDMEELAGEDADDILEELREMRARAANTNIMHPAGPELHRCAAAADC
jgi:cytochrome c553